MLWIHTTNTVVSVRTLYIPDQLSTTSTPCTCPTFFYLLHITSFAIPTQNCSLSWAHMHFVYKKRIPSIFKDESTGSCICLRSLIYMSHVNKVQPKSVKMICIAAIHVKDNVSRSFEMRHVIHDIRIISGQWPRCDATYGAVRCPRSYEISAS
jgi:hypothetical protein